MEKHSRQFIKLYSRNRLYRTVPQDRHLRDGERYNSKTGAKRRGVSQRKSGWMKNRGSKKDWWRWKGYEKGRSEKNQNVDEAERENKGRGRETIKQLDNATCSGILLLQSAIYTRVNQKLLEHGEHLNFRHLSTEERRERKKLT